MKHSDLPAAPTRVVKCPTCAADVRWCAESRWRPFCSERCKLIDLGAWATQSYRLEAAEAASPASQAPGTDH